VTVSGIVVACAPGVATITATAAGRFAASCLVTVAGPSADAHIPQAQVYGYGNVLRLIGLEGFDCRIVALSGQTLAAFRCASPDETLRCTLPSAGLYILRAQRDGTVITLKFITAN
jgi:hypothetical protein